MNEIFHASQAEARGDFQLYFYSMDNITGVCDLPGQSLTRQDATL